MAADRPHRAGRLGPGARPAGPTRPRRPGAVRAGRPMSGRSVTVVDPGAFTTVQDEGRPGLAVWGVGRSGAADRGAAALANRLVANRPRAALLEVTLGGL